MDPPNTNAENKESSTSPTELFSSAQVLQQAAMSSFHNETDKVNKAKAAAAAEDLLQGASQYGKLDKTSYGEYVEKAEGYLHQYSEPGVTKETTETKQVETPALAPEDGGAAKEPEKKEEESSGGVESYVKMAEGLVNKEGGDSAPADKSGGGDSAPADKSGGGFGGALKMAGGLFK